jgi:hypothetical protein
LKAEIAPCPVSQVDDQVRVSADYTPPSGSPKRLWFSFPSRYRPWLTENADPFVVGFLFEMMRFGGNVHVRGSVSPSLLRNLEEFAVVWRMWAPDLYRPMTITADVEQEPPQTGAGRTIMAFSGGLDSCCSAWNHHTRAMGRRTRTISAGVFVHGFDIPVSDVATFERALKKNVEIASSIGMELIPVGTNFRELDCKWMDAHGAAIAASLMLWSRHFDSGLIAASAPYDVPVERLGSTPLTDRLLSSRKFEIVHDGAEFGRPERARVVSHWPEGLRNLRVCWAGQRLYENCCRCEKCIRTILEFRTIGVPLPPAFAHDVTDELIRNLDLATRTKLFPMRRVLKAAIARGLGSESWVKALQGAVRRAENGGSRSARTQAARYFRSAVKRLIRGPQGKR